MGNDKKISMSEIAELSGVSIATVSRVLNQNGRFSPETEKRVLDVIEKNGYMVNQSAKGLRTNKTLNIGVIVPDITNEFFARIIRTVEQMVIPKGYTVIVCDSNEDEHMEDRHIQTLASKGVDGIIYISVKTDVKKIFEAYHIPVVYIDRRPENAGVLINSDNKQGGFLATEELIKSGCRNILLLKDKNNHSTVIQRLEGYKNALEKYKVNYNKALVRDIDISYNSAYDTVNEMILNDVKFDGIFCNNDLIAIAALHALRANSISVPDKVKIVGYDGVSYSEVCDPQLSTIYQDTNEMGEQSVKQLFELMNEGTSKNKEITIPVKLLRRASSQK